MKVRTVLLLGCGLSLILGSGCQNPLEPKQACETNNTGSVQFENRSAGSTYTIVWDGATKTTIGPGQTSASFEAAAGVTHTLQFKFSNSSLAACNASSPVLTQCHASTFSCAG